MPVWYSGCTAVSVMTALPSRMVMCWPGERRQLVSEIVGAVVFVDAGFVVYRPEIAKTGIGI